MDTAQWCLHCHAMPLTHSLVSTRKDVRTLLVTSATTVKLHSGTPKDVSSGALSAIMRPADAKLIFATQERSKHLPIQNTGVSTVMPSPSVNSTFTNTTHGEHPEVLLLWTHVVWLADHIRDLLAQRQVITSKLSTHNMGMSERRCSNHSRDTLLHRTKSAELLKLHGVFATTTVVVINTDCVLCRLEISPISLKRAFSSTRWTSWKTNKRLCSPTAQHWY